MPLQQQQLLLNGKEIRNAEKLSAVGVNDGDLVMMVSLATSRYDLLHYSIACICEWLCSCM